MHIKKAEKENEIVSLNYSRQNYTASTVKCSHLAHWTHSAAIETSVIWEVVNENGFWNILKS